MAAKRRWPDPVAAARQLLTSTADASPATTPDPWTLLGRYRRALAELVAVQDLEPMRPGTAAEAAMAEVIRGGSRCLR